MIDYNQIKSYRKCCRHCIVYKTKQHIFLPPDDDNNEKKTKNLTYIHTDVCKKVGYAPTS